MDELYDEFKSKPRIEPIEQSLSVYVINKLLHEKNSNTNTKSNCVIS